MNTTDENVIAIKEQIKALQKSIRKPRPQKKKWYFPSGVWIMIKEYMGIKNSKFMNKFLEPLTAEEKSLATKFKNVLKLCEEYPLLWRIVETHEKIKANYLHCEDLESLCDESLCVDKKYRGISDLKVFLKVFPELATKKIYETDMVGRIKSNMINDGEYDSDDNDNPRRIKDEKWDDV